jgi:ABC-2 type transport system permease protein
MASIQLRTGWKAMLTWVLALGATMVLTTTSISGLYDTQAKIDTYAAAVTSGDALLAINGKVAGIDTLGGVIANEFGFMASFAIPLMGISLIARMTRKDEEAGRLETLLSGRIGRAAPVVAAVLLASLALVVTGLALWAGLLAVGVPTTDALLYAVSLSALGLTFTGLAALASQLVEHSRGVYGIGLGALVLAYLLRGTGDVLDSWLTWLSPLGWAEETRAYGDARWWPLLVPLVATVVLVAAAVAIASRRDLDSARFRRGASQPRASRVLRTEFGTAARLQRGSAIGWAVAAVVVSATFGALSQQLIDAMEGNPSLAEAFGGAGSATTDGVLAMSVLILALICGGYAVQAAGAVRSEETSGRLESTLSGDIGRMRWLTTHVVVLIAGLLVVGAFGGIALAVSTAASTGDSALVGRTLGAVVAYLPAELLLAAVALALFGVLPRAEAVAWLVFAATVVIAYLGEPLNMPDAVVNSAPFNRVGYPPLDPAQGGNLVLLSVVAAVLLGIGYLGFRRRGIPAG